jgi:acetyltransferase-like isoleucine patch superfamily enzyme
VSLAPITLFVYNRPWHTQKTVEALQKNKLAKESELFIYSDEVKNGDAQKSVDEVRAYIANIDGFKKITIIKREKNWGLADSIIDGVTKIVNEYGRIIVLEDDLVTSPYFLKFMNEALEFYKDKDRVWHISGWNNPIETDGLDDVFLWRAMNCWGWATWADKWCNFDKNIDLTIKEFSKKDIVAFNLDGYQDFWSQVVANKKQVTNTWAVFWYACIFKNNGLCLNPSKTFVVNIGIDSSGDNCGSNDTYKIHYNENNNIKFTNKYHEDNLALSRIQSFNKSIATLSLLWKKLIRYNNIIKYPLRTMYKLIKLYRLRFKFPMSRIESNTSISYENISLINLKENSYIGNFTVISVNNYDRSKQVSYFELGNNSIIGELNNIRASGGSIIIGDNCLIAQNVSLIAANHKIDKNELIMKQEWDTTKTSIIIKNDVWIGSNVVVLPGITIENGAVIAAGSIVTKNVATNSIVAGTPAKHIKFRT